ncbi:MAG TPA: hypothetical protein VGQ81_06330 [Acidobacteriota bacterium]|nr:hypothetical protein [Acidobacteriota bacterium]
MHKQSSRRHRAAEPQPKEKADHDHQHLHVGTRRAATGRERRADVTLCDYTSAALLQQRYGTFRFCESDRDDSIWRAAPFRSRLCGCRQQARSRRSCAPLGAARVTPLVVALRLL